MKMRKILSVLLLGTIIFAVPLFADEGIYLPDITTVVEDKSEDFIPEIKMTLSEPIVLPEGTVNVEIKIPPVEKKEEVVIVEPETVPENKPLNEKTISVSGEAGLSHSGDLKGKIVLTENKENPFHLGMTYNSNKDFLNKSFIMDGGKVFVSENEKNKWAINGSVIDLENGLQDKATGSFYCRNDYNLSGSYTRVLPKGFEVYSSLKGDIYCRKVDKFENDCFTYLKPELKASWAFKDLKISVGGNYSWEQDGSESTHRGYTGAEVFWKNKFVSLSGSAGALFGNRIGDNVCLVPFTVSTEFHFPVSFAEKEVSVSLKGGMDSQGKTTASMEQDYPYSSLGNTSQLKLPGEVSDWYGKADIFVPVKSSFGLNVNFEYRKTAFENKFLQADYNGLVLGNGLYGFESVNRQLISSKEAVSYNSENLNLSLGWASYFDFVPATVPAQEISLNADMKFKGIKLAGDMKFPVIASDKTPDLRFEASYEVNSAVRIAIIIEDTVKLINGQSRSLYGQYDSRKGSASLLLNFNF